MKGRIIAGLLAFALGFSGCGSTETVFTQTTVETAVSSMSTSAETTINFTPTISTTQPTETITETTAKPEQSELKNLDEIIKDVEARNEYFEVADSKKINLNNDSFDDVIVLSLIYTEVNFSYYVFDGKTYTLLNDVKIMRAFNFDKQIFEFGSIPGEIENLIIKDFEYGGERIKTIVFSRHFYFEQLNYIAEIIIDSENEFYIKPLFCFGIVVEETATGTLYAPRYYEFIDGERAELTASEFYLLTSEYLGDEEIAFSTDPEFAFEPDSVNIRGYKIPLDCEEFAIINPDMSGRPIIENTIEISGNITDEDITAISKLKNLRTLGLMNVGLTDISFLNSNKNLEKIYLDYNDITDIKLFSNFSHLNQLSLSYNPIKDISSLSKLASLGYLDVSFTDINSISDLPENLISLFIQNVDIKSFDEIGRLKKLKILNICGNKIDDISFLKNLSELEDLYAANNAITDIGALENKDLKIIHMTENEIEDFSVISGLNSPTELWMDFTDTDAVYFKKLFPECIILNYS
jgi:Leucine-rich repeat (LRR) protein